MLEAKIFGIEENCTVKNIVDKAIEIGLGKKIPKNPGYSALINAEYPLLISLTTVQEENSQTRAGIDFSTYESGMLNVKVKETYSKNHKPKIVQIPDLLSWFFGKLKPESIALHFYEAGDEKGNCVTVCKGGLVDLFRQGNFISKNFPEKYYHLLDLLGIKYGSSYDGIVKKRQFCNRATIDKVNAAYKKMLEQEINKISLFTITIDWKGNINHLYIGERWVFSEEGSTKEKIYSINSKGGAVELRVNKFDKMQEFVAGKLNLKLNKFKWKILRCESHAKKKVNTPEQEIQLDGVYDFD